jgi:hypothetical protein
MELKPGELYFIRERDPLTRETSNYVKIGLVKDNGGRTSDVTICVYSEGLVAKDAYAYKNFSK